MGGLENEIRATLAKQSHNSFEKNNIEVNIKATHLSVELARWLGERGHEARGTAANNFYRKEVSGWQKTLPPDEAAQEFEKLDPKHKELYT